MKPAAFPSLSDNKRDIVRAFLEIGDGLIEASDFIEPELDPKKETDLISKGVASLRFLVDSTLANVDGDKTDQEILEYKTDYLERFSAMRKKFQEITGIQAKMAYFHEICSDLIKEEDRIRTIKSPKEIDVPQRQNLNNNLQDELRKILTPFGLEDFEKDAVMQRYSAFLNVLLKKAHTGPWFNPTLVTLQQYEVLYILKAKLANKSREGRMLAVDEWFDEIKPLSEVFLSILETVEIKPDGRFEVKWAPSDIKKNAFVVTEALEIEELKDIEEIEAEAVLEVEGTLEVKETKKTIEQLEEAVRVIRLQIFNYFSNILWSNFSDANVVNAALLEIMDTLTIQFKQLSPEKRVRFQELWPAIGEGLQQGLSSSINGSRLKFLEQWLANARNMRQRITAKPQDAPPLSNEISTAQSATAFN